MKRRYGLKVLIAFAILAAAGLTGCNTLDGMGRDFESAGEAIQDAAN